MTSTTTGCPAHQHLHGARAATAWWLIASLLRLAPSAEVTETVDEFDGAVLAVSAEGWAGAVRLDARGIEVLAPVLIERWTWRRFVSEQTPAGFAALLLATLGQPSRGTAGSLTAEAARDLAMLLLTGDSGEACWRVGSLFPDGGSRVLLREFPQLADAAVEFFESAVVAGEGRSVLLPSWVAWRAEVPQFVMMADGVRLVR